MYFWHGICKVLKIYQFLSIPEICVKFRRSSNACFSVSPCACSSFRAEPVSNQVLGEGLALNIVCDTSHDHISDKRLQQIRKFPFLTEILKFSKKIFKTLSVVVFIGKKFVPEESHFFSERSNNHQIAVKDNWSTWL